MYKEGIVSDELLSLIDDLDNAVLNAYGFIHEDGKPYTDDEILPGMIKLYKQAMGEEKSPK